MTHFKYPFIFPELKYPFNLSSLTEVYLLASDYFTNKRKITLTSLGLKD